MEQPLPNRFWCKVEFVFVLFYTLHVLMFQMIYIYQLHSVIEYHRMRYAVHLNWIQSTCIDDHFVKQDINMIYLPSRFHRDIYSGRYIKGIDNFSTFGTFNLKYHTSQKWQVVQLNGKVSSNVFKRRGIYRLILKGQDERSTQPLRCYIHCNSWLLKECYINLTLSTFNQYKVSCCI